MRRSLLLLIALGFACSSDPVNVDAGAHPDATIARLDATAHDDATTAHDDATTAHDDATTAHDDATTAHDDATTPAGEDAATNDDAATEDDAGVIEDAAIGDGGGPGDSGAGNTCGALGRACGPGMECGGDPSLQCTDPPGLCMPIMPTCGGFAQAQCPNATPHCLYYRGADYGPCFTFAQRMCICGDANLRQYFPGC